MGLSRLPSSSSGPQTVSKCSASVPCSRGRSHSVAGDGEATGWAHPGHGLPPSLPLLSGLHLSTSEKIFRFQDTGLLLRVLGSLFLGGILAFGLGFSEFLLVSRTSSLTLSIAGIFKEVCTLLLAAHLLGDQISLLNWLGFALCVSGISLHVALKALHSKGDGSPKPLKGQGSNPDRELLLWSSQQGEDDYEEEEDCLVAQGQQ